MNRNVRLAVRLAVVACSAYLSVTAAFAQSEVREYQIVQQSLDEALRKFALASKLDLLFPPDLVAGMTSPALDGSFTVDEGLKALLHGSGLVFKVSGSRVVITRSKASAQRQATSSSSTNDGTNDYIRVAQLQGDTLTRHDALPELGEVPAKKVTEIDEVIVTGSRLRQKADDGPVPVTTFDRDKIRQLGVESVAGVLNFLPQQSFSRAEGFSTAGSQVAQLRGLGVGTTLVLVNGRRTITSALLGSVGAFDLNTIPLSAVERIEVLSSSASAVYGADAVGGVINVILRSRIDDPTLDIYYGGADGGARERRGSLALGHATERFRGTFIFDYSDRGMLSGERRELFADNDFRRFGSADRRSAFSNPTTITSLTEQNLPGLSDRFAAVPRGSTGIGLTPDDFLATAGTRNMESLNRFRSIVPATERKSAVATLEFDVTDSTSAFGEFMYADRDVELASTPSSITATVPVSNPFNAFGVPVSVSYLFSELGPRWSLANSESLRAVAGLKGRWRSNYNWEVSLLSIQEDGEEEQANRINNARVNSALAQTDPTLALNLFRDGPAGTPALLASLLSDPVTNAFASDALQGSAIFSGPLISLPTGALDFAVGAEWRKEKLLLDVISSSVLIDADRNSYSVFQELRLPLVSEERAARGVGSITAALAGRYDHYSDFGGTYNPEFRLEWKPTEDLLIRASYGDSFRPPSLFELYSPVRESAGPFADPRRNNEVVPLTVTSGGNPNLEPEEATSLVAGFVLRLPRFANMQADASYWRISQESRVQRLPLGLVLANEASFPDRVTRAAPTPEDLAAGRPGRLLGVDITGINFGSLKTAGVDARVSGEVRSRAGTWSASLAATWVATYEAADLPETQAVERVGIANSQGSIPRWHAAATLAWNQGIWGAAATVRDAASYGDVNTLNVRNGRIVNPQRIVDIQASLNLSATDWRALPGVDKLTLRAGISNLFDEAPTFTEANENGFDLFQADIRQRFAYASLSLGF